MPPKHSSSDIDINKDIDFAVVKKFLPYLFKHKGRIGVALLFLVLAKSANVGLPFVLKYVVDDLSPASGESMPLVVVPLALLLAYGGLRFAHVLFGEIRDSVFGRATERMTREIALTVFEHLHRLDLSFHLDRKTGGLARDIERGTSGISFLMRFLVFNIVPTLLEIAMVAGLLLVNYGIEFALIVLCSVVAYVAFTVVATTWRTKFIRAANKADSASNTLAVDSLLNFETVKYFGNEQFEAKRYDVELNNLENAKRKNRLTLLVLNSGQAFIITSALTMMMILAAYHVVDGTMTIGDFVLINAFMMQIFIPLNFLGFVYREIRGSLANIDKLFELLEQQPKVKDAPNAQPLVVLQGVIEFKAVDFRYHADRAIIQGVSFSLQAGQKVAVVGPSGSGKSTLVKLLFRFYDVDGGQICIDGQGIDQVTQSSLRDAIGIVPQDTVLFNDSILENVRYGCPQASDEQVKAAIKMAHLDAFIANLPDGYQTRVGERGLKLSGGEKQRVAIARTILKRPRILVFDEATSSLDSHSERAVLSAFKDIQQGSTTLVIAHRLSTIVDADKIVVLKNGKVVEQGSHEQLLCQAGEYAHLWQIQGQSES